LPTQLTSPSQSFPQLRGGEAFCGSKCVPEHDLQIKLLLHR